MLRDERGRAGRGFAGPCVAAATASRCPRNLVPLAIDELPVLFIAAACAQGETSVTGAEELRVKESDRIAAMSAGLTALGVAHTALPDGMRIEGRGAGTGVSGGEVDSFGDHRIAMSLQHREPACRRRRSRSAMWPMSPPRFPGSCHWRDRWDWQFSESTV